MIKLINLLIESASKNYNIYCDLDGVLCDFDKQFEASSNGIKCKDFEQKYGIEAFWELITKQGTHFWSEMDWMPEGKQLWDYIKKYNPIILSAPSRDDSSKIGKKMWVDKYMPNTKLILASRQDKKTYAGPKNILIDDRKDNILSWVEAEGNGIVYVSTSQTIEDLKKFNL